MSTTKADIEDRFHIPQTVINKIERDGDWVNVHLDHTDVILTNMLENQRIEHINVYTGDSVSVHVKTDDGQYAFFPEGEA